MEDVLIDLSKQNIDVLFVGLLKQPRYLMERIEIIPNLIPKKHVFAKVFPNQSFVEGKLEKLMVDGLKVVRAFI